MVHIRELKKIQRFFPTVKRILITRVSSGSVFLINRMQHNGDAALLKNQKNQKNQKSEESKLKSNSNSNLI